MNKIICIYSITNLIDNKKYIGQSVNFNDRHKNHVQKLNSNKHKNPHLQNAWNKYGESNFIFDILVVCDIKQLDNEESRIILEYKTLEREYGYNLREGGHFSKHSEESRRKLGDIQRGKPHTKEHIENFRKSIKKHYEDNGGIGHMRGRKHTEKTKEKISKANQGFKHTEEMKQHLSNEKIGMKNPRYGKPMSELNKQKILEATKGIPRSEEIKQKISDGWSDETRKRVGLDRSGANNPNYGKGMSEETKIHLRIARQNSAKLRRLESLDI